MLKIEEIMFGGGKKGMIFAEAALIMCVVWDVPKRDHDSGAYMLDM
jgi:hypothetical protein